MLKKALAAMLTVMLSVTVIGCSSSKETKIESKEVVENVSLNEGEFSKNYTQSEVETLNSEIEEDIKEVINFYGLEYLENTEAKEENGEVISDKYIYFDNLEAEPNRIESMYYSYKTYGEDKLKASLGLKIGFKLDLEQIKNESRFNFEETSMANFVQVLTKDSERDYSEINKKIIDIVNSESKTGTIATNVEGLDETIMIKDDYLLYKLDSKIYDFQ